MYFNTMNKYINTLTATCENVFDQLCDHRQHRVRTSLGYLNTCGAGNPSRLANLCRVEILAPAEAGPACTAADGERSAPEPPIGPRPTIPAHPPHAGRSKHSSHRPFRRTDSIWKIYSSHPPKTL